MRLQGRLNRLLAKMPKPCTENGLPCVVIQNGIISYPAGLTMSELESMQVKPYQIILNGVIKDEY